MVLLGRIIAQMGAVVHLERWGLQTNRSAHSRRIGGLASAAPTGCREQKVVTILPILYRSWA